MSQAAAAPPLPDVNHEIHPFGVVQHLLDQTADFVLIAVPDPGYSERATLTPAHPQDFFGINGGYGVAFRSHLHTFDSRIDPTSHRVEQRTGKAVGTLTCRCLFGPDDLQWDLSGEPESRIYDPYRPRRFAMVDATFDFGSDDRCIGYAIGRSTPLASRCGAKTMAGGVGNVTGGTGAFKGLEGTFVMTGFFTPELGFRGMVTLRMIDPLAHIRSDREFEPLWTGGAEEDGSAFYVFRGEKKDRTVRTTFGPPRGDEMSLITPSQMRSAQFTYRRHGQRRIETGMRSRSVAAGMMATVYFNLMAPPGTPTHPVPFSTEEIYTFPSAGGGVAGTVYAEVQDGISFNLKFPALKDQPGVRFSGFGPITGGTGCMEGAQGMLTVNSLIGISPHALSLIHVLHIVDPDGRFRTVKACG